MFFDGVNAAGETNTKEVFYGQGVGPDGVDYGNGYYRNYYRGASENFVEDADWIRLRNLSLSYDLPAKLLGSRNFVKGVSLTLTGYNLWISTDYSGFDPEGNRANGSRNEGLGGFTYPAVKSYTATINVSF